MTPETLFIFCIITRFIIAYVAYISPTNIILRSFSLTVGIGFMYYYLSGTRTTGPETFGKPIWWNSVRPIHSFNYILFFILSFYKPEYAFIPLVCDVLIGVLASCYLPRKI